MYFAPDQRSCARTFGLTSRGARLDHCHNIVTREQRWHRASRHACVARSGRCCWRSRVSCRRRRPPTRAGARTTAATTRPHATNYDRRSPCGRSTCTVQLGDDADARRRRSGGCRRAASSGCTKAAEAGMAQAQYNLGLLYESGIGVPRSLTFGDRVVGESRRAGSRRRAGPAGDAILPRTRRAQGLEACRAMVRGRGCKRRRRRAIHHRQLLRTRRRRCAGLAQGSGLVRARGATG